MSTKLYWEDFKSGAVFIYGPRLVTREKIVAFAAEFDPQRFHFDEDAGTASHFGALCVSSWHAAPVWMRPMVDFRRRMVEQAHARGEPVGLRDLKWLKPIYVGDTIDYSSEVVETRPSGNRPDFGLLTVHSTGVNQNGEAVITFLSTTFVEWRPETV